jgi:hypothetical protein
LVRFHSAQKFFLVADVQTGEVRANISLGHAVGMNPSLLVPGVNNDVFIGVPGGIARLYV